MANYMTFEDLQNEVARAIGDSGVAKRDLIKHAINQVYLTELLNCDDLYPLHWLHQYFEWKLHAPKTITGITQANPGVITAAAHGFLGNEIILLWDIGGMVELNHDNAASSPLHAFFYVNRINANTFSLYDQDGQEVDTTSYTAYTSGGTINHHGIMASACKEITDIGLYDGNPLTPIDWKTFMLDPGRFFDKTTSTPEWYLPINFFDGDGGEYMEILTFPAAQQEEIAYFGRVVRADKLDANSDVPLLPFEFHPAIVSGAVTRLAENNVQVENAVIWPGLYGAQIEALKSHNRKWWDRQENRRDQKPYGLL